MVSSELFLVYLLLFKSSCISASAAKLLRCASCGKSASHSLGAGRGKDIFYAICENITKRDISLVVKAAGDNGPVAKNAEMVL